MHVPVEPGGQRHINTGIGGLPVLPGGRVDRERGRFFRCGTEGSEATVEPADGGRMGRRQSNLGITAFRPAG